MNKQINARDTLIALYMDWRNNYLSVALFAEHHGLTVEEANKLLDLALAVASHDHPEA